MNLFFKTFVSIFLFILLLSCKEDQPTEITETPGTINLFNKILFYDGYAETVSDPVPDGVYRIANSKYVTKINEGDLAKVGGNLELEIVVEAACDNYDRIGNVFLSLMDKGEDYDQDNLQGRIEMARFITPFMDKNKSPNQVPYSFDVSNIAKILRDSELSSKYDFWIEFDIFGVPYDANKYIAGCAGKNYVFYGSVSLVSTVESESSSSQNLIPIASFEKLNNYKHTDVIGETVRTFSIEVPSDLENAMLYLITSNHGANSGGEEYNRRTHNIYFDDVSLDSYVPGGLSCEAYRVYNTQANFIYGGSVQTESYWTSWNNWCPGDVIPIRDYSIGSIEAGTHTFKIEVPDAKFVGKQGQIPLSVYIQGDK